VTFGPYDEPPTAGTGEVVLALPPLAAALPVAWDRYLRNRLRHPYEAWLEAVLSDPPQDWPTVRSFWERHRYGELVERWVAAVGVDRLVVSIAAPSQPLLTSAPAEVLRRVNVAFHHREWPASRYDEVVRRGVLPALTQRPGAAAITPGWATKRANAIAAAELPRITATGVRIDGEVAALARVGVPRAAVGGDPSPLTLDAAADAVISAVESVAATWQR
jgi:hypothetical protein